MKDVTAIIPALNESSTIGNLISQLKTKLGVEEVLVIDDGSADDTGAVAAKAGARVIRHRFQRGNGAAVKTGLKQAATDFVLIVDADGQHQLEDVEKILSAPEDWDLVVGARPFRWSHFRDFGNLVLRTGARFMVRKPVPDLTSGLRRLNRHAALQFWHLYPEGYSFPSTSTLLFLASGYPALFVPISNRPRPAGSSPSKLHPFADGFRFLTIIYRMMLLTFPLRVFAPIGILLILSSVGWTVRTMLLTSQVSAFGLLLFLSGLTILLFGTIADQLSQIRRSLANRSN